MGLLIMLVGFFQSWGVALSILNLCLISSVMSMGVNMQWGYSGLINFGVMGFLAIGGLAVIVISVPPVYAAWDAGGTGIIMSGLLLAALVYAVFYVHSKVTSKYKNYIIFVLVISIVPIMKVVSGPSIHAIESIDAATSGYLGGFNMPIIFLMVRRGATCCIRSIRNRKGLLRPKVRLSCNCNALNIRYRNYYCET